MAYKIHYSEDAAKRYPQKTKRHPIKYGRWVLLMSIIAAALWLRLNGIPDFLIPGDPAVTRQAASAMMENLHSGTGFGDAVTVFCKEILHGAGF